MYAWTITIFSVRYVQSRIQSDKPPTLATSGVAGELQCLQQDLP